MPAPASGLDAAHAFEKLVAAARERMRARHGSGDTPFYCVPFHSDFAEDLRDEHRAVRFIRRSPDPTVQLVRAAALRATRGMDPSVPLSMSDRIARANLDTLRREGPERLRELLSQIRAYARFRA